MTNNLGVFRIHFELAPRADAGTGAEKGEELTVDEVERLGEDAQTPRR